MVEISREEQKHFAREIINISERDTSPETLASLLGIVTVFMSCVGKDNSIAINLSEYIYELKQIAEGGEDTGWKDEFKSIIDKDLNS